MPWVSTDTADSQALLTAMPEQTSAEIKESVDDSMFILGLGLGATELYAFSPQAAMYYGANTGNAKVYTWGAEKTGALPASIGNLYSKENIDDIEEYLTSTLDAYNGVESAHNPTMIQRQRDILSGKITATQQDMDWMRHELYERNLVQNQGVNACEAHQKTLGAFGNKDWDLWPSEVYWKHRESLGNNFWDRKMQER